VLFLKIDQKRNKEENSVLILTEKGEKQGVPKELRNLFFDVNFKEGEPRSESKRRGRKLITQL